MAYDEQLAERVRASLKGERGLEERRMFGGLRGWLTVGAEACARPAEVRRWVKRGASYAKGLPKKSQE